MAGKDVIMATQQDLKKLHVVRKAMEKNITQNQAAEILDLSDRQIRRIATRIQAEGDKGVIHKLRGKASNRALPGKERILRLFKAKYPDFGPTLASEKLFERDKIEVNDETLRLWLIKDGVPYKKRKKRPHRQWRERRRCFGEMIQMDGSDHDWLEARGPRLIFMGYIDDATGTPFGRFYEYEGTIPAMDSFKRYIERYGIPVSIYIDKHAAYKSKKKLSIEDELENKDPLTQFTRALGELGVEVIYANSPQAKGRIERLFKTFQDRLLKELRLEKARTIDQANKVAECFLPKYAQRFSVKAVYSDDLHRPIPKGLDLGKILCKREEHPLRNDFTVVHDKKLYQIEDDTRAKKVGVEERLDGSMLITYKDKPLKFREITVRPRKEEHKKTYEFKIRKVYVPPRTHPYKRYFNAQYSQYQQREKVAPKEKGLLLTLT
jgi:transposase